MYRPPDHFLLPPPARRSFPCRIDGIRTQIRMKTHKRTHWTLHRDAHVATHAYGQHITETLRVMTCTRGDSAPADYTIVNTNRNLLYMCQNSCCLRWRLRLAGRLEMHKERVVCNGVEVFGVSAPPTHTCCV